MTIACLTAVSGCNAALATIDAAAHNLANVNTDGFKSLRVIHSEKVPYGAASSVEADQSPGIRFFDLQGRLREYSNTDVTRGIIDLMNGLQAFKVNCQTIRTEESLSGWFLDITA